MSKQTVQYLEHFRKLLFWVLMILMLAGVWSQWMDYELFVAFIFKSAAWVINSDSCCVYFGYHSLYHVLIVALSVQWEVY